MTQVKLLILVVNLVFVRLALVSAGESSLEVTKETSLPGGHQAQVGAALFDKINSLDFAPNEQTINLTSTNHQAQDKQNGLHDADVSSSSSSSSLYLHQVKNGDKETRNRRKAKSGAGANMSNLRRHAVPSTIPQLLFSLLGQLEKVDVKRIIMDSIAQMRSGVDLNANGRSAGQRQTIKRRSSNSNSGSNSTPKSSDLEQAATSAAANQTSKSKERLDVNSLAGDTGNLLSITRQLAKLARSQVLGGAEFGSPSSWFSPSPSMASSMFSGAGGSHFNLDPVGHDFTAAGFKSDWFWLVVPAVIVIGAGVIVVPLIAAWLVSQMMGHNTFTVSAGRRRRRRDVNSSQASDPLAFESTHKDLFRMLDIHQFLDDPQFLTEKLAQFHKALESASSSFIKSSLSVNNKLKQ